MATPEAEREGVRAHLRKLGTRQARQLLAAIECGWADRA
jgi:hypothetical protein